MRLWLLPGAIALLAAGCASTPTGQWYGPADPQRRAADEYECLRASSLGPGAPLVIPGVDTTIHGRSGVTTTIPGMPMVLPAPPERDWAVYDACLKARGWEYRVDAPPAQPGWLLKQGDGGPGLERWPSEAACAERQRLVRPAWPAAYCVSEGASALVP
jgi:hypothetical protein